MEKLESKFPFVTRHVTLKFVRFNMWPIHIRSPVVIFWLMLSFQIIMTHILYFLGLWSQHTSTHI